MKNLHSACNPRFDCAALSAKNVKEKMKKLLITTLILLMLTLTACSASDSPATASISSTDSLPIATQLLLGTMKLDGTEQDVTAEQAAKLLPFWQVYSELLTSDIAVQEEIDGLVTQIQETMTSEQIQSIEDMALTQQDVIAAMQESGGGMSQAQQSSSSGSGSSSGGFAPPDGGMAMGAPPDGGEIAGGVPIASQSSSGGDSSATEAIQDPMGGGVPSALIDALIELLQSKANS
jgi:hypothetical protein